jgi:hypothetical protein
MADIADGGGGVVISKGMKPYGLLKIIILQ